MSALPAPLEVTLNGANLTSVAVVAAIAVVALIMAMVFRREVLAANDGTTNMRAIALGVQEGAAAYLRRQFRTLSVFAVAAFLLLFLLPVHQDSDTSIGTLKIARSIAFLAGATFSALIGYLGMWLAVRANVRVASAARSNSRDAAMKIAFRTGAHVGMATVGLGLLGAAIVVLIFRGDAPTILEGFGFGAAMLAMFMRVGGGIFTKAADVGADLVGKVEQNIPEDDPRNAATIADNVGDNVGDCAGMAADLFESYAVTLVAALILGMAAFGSYGLVFPADRPRYRCDHRHHRRLSHQATRRRERPQDHQALVLSFCGNISRALRDCRFCLPARQFRRPRCRGPDAGRDQGPAAGRHRLGNRRHRARRDHLVADRLLHRH